MNSVFRSNAFRLLLAVWAAALLIVASAARVAGQEPSPDFNADNLFGDTTEGTTGGQGPTAEAGQGAAAGTEGQPGDQPQPQGPTAEEVYQEAKQLQEQGKLAEAIERYSQLAYDQTLAVPALVQRGKCFTELKEPGQAVQSFTSALQRMTGYAAVTHEGLGIRIEPYQILLEMGKALIDEGRMADAMDELSQAIEVKPSDPELYYYRGLAQSKQAAGLPGRDRFDALTAAVASFDRAIELKEDYAEARFERGSAQAELAAMTGEKWDEAIEDLEKARELDPKNLEYIVKAGVARLRRARMKTDPDPEETKEIIADHEYAIEAFDQFIREYPDRPEAESPQGAVGQTEPASPEQDLLAAEDDEEKTTLEDAHVMRADAHVSLAKYLPAAKRDALYHAAIEDCDAAVAIDSKLFFAYYNRGIAWRLLGDLDQAIDDFTKALKITGGFPSASLRRGIIWFHRGEFQLALADFRKAMQGQPDGRAKFWSGTCHAQLGDYATAVEEYSDALRQNPNYTLAYNNRGLAYLHLGLYQRALEDFDELVGRDRSNARAHLRRGLAYEGLGQADEAMRAFAQAKQLDPTLTIPTIGG